MTIFETALVNFIDINHKLVLLAQRIDWSEGENEFSDYYCKDNGRPSVLARKMGGLMYLKSRYNISDEDVVSRWTENPYIQYLQVRRYSRSDLRYILRIFRNSGSG